jgi:sugar lactone lactonase YvrE
MKNLFFIVIAVIAYSSMAFSQDWVYEEDFAYGDYPHGVVVTPNGKIWVGFFSRTGVTPKPYNPIKIYNPDGSLHRELRLLTYEGETDTIYSCRGISLDYKGNVLFTNHNTLWRINYRTYTAMNKVTPPGNASLTEAASDAKGNIYITHVVPNGKPFYIYNKNFELIGYVKEQLYSIQRSIIVSPNGKHVLVGKIYGGNEGNGIIHYYNEKGPQGQYTQVGVYQTAIWAQCLDVDLRGRLWIGSYWDVGPDDSTGWYALNMGINMSHDFEIVDRIGENVGMNPAVGPQPPLNGTYYAPRGIAWSRGFRTMYTADFDGHVIKKWRSVKGWPHSQKEISWDAAKPEVPQKYSLGQNYPNPFNPSTSIRFALPKAADAKLTIYDINGREVRRLVSGYLEAGYHEIQWNATDNNGARVASGIYLYRVQAGSFIQTRKMTLLK